MTENQRLKVLMSRLGFKKQKDFATSLNIKEGSLSDILREKVGVSSSIKDKLEFMYGVNSKWIETGEGEMFKRAVPEKLTEPKNQTNRKVPYYEIDVSASVVGVFTDSAIEAPSSELSVPGLEDCDFAVPVYGNSMYPIYENGTIIVCKEIENKQLINYGEVYFIVTRDYRMVKRLQRGNTESTILAESENQEKRPNGKPKYEPLELPVDEILKLYLVKGCVKRNQL